MEIIINLPKLELKGEAVLWNETDPGYKKYAGSVYLNNNYRGFLRHDGKVELFKQNLYSQKRMGVYVPSNFIYA